MFESNSMETNDLHPTRITIAIISSSNNNNNYNNGSENVGRWQVGERCWRRSVRCEGARLFRAS